jgi:hypothetical protein
VSKVKHKGFASLRGVNVMGPAHLVVAEEDAFVLLRRLDVLVLHNVGLRKTLSFSQDLMFTNTN